MEIKKLLVIVSMMISITAHAQMNPFGATFFQNQYLTNPAMAGLKDGISINGGINKQWSSIEGAPASQYISGELRAKKVGVGVNMNTDQSGIFRFTRLLATYAYHLPLNDANDLLHFGISFGTYSQRIAMEAVKGSLSDFLVQSFNERDAVLDGDFGMAYTTERFTIQGAIPNLRNFLKRERYNSANWNTFFTAVSYRLFTNDASFVIEPKLAYSGVRGYDDVFDAGVYLETVSGKFNGSFIYHSSKTMSLGMGFNNGNFSVLGMYTSSVSAFKAYSNGNFEIGLGYNFK